MASTANIISTTKDWWNSTVQEEGWMTILLMNMLISRNQVKFKAGKAYKLVVQTGSLEDLAQSYDDNTPLQSGVNQLAINPIWRRKRVQIPVKILESEQEEQSGGGDAVVVSYPEMLVKNGQDSMRQKLNSMVYGAGADGDLTFQGLISALNHDQTYGTYARATTATNEKWQGASLGKSFTDQDTAVAANLYYVRQSVDAIGRYNNPKPGDLAGITSNEVFRSLQSQVDPNQPTPSGNIARYGFRSLFIDGVEIIADPYLSHNASNSTTKTYFFMLHMPDWKLILSPKLRLGYMTDFFDQSKINNGLPEDLARIKIAGNLVCQAPNRSIWLSDMS